MKEANLTIDQTTNVSLVAFYGDKPAELINLIQQLQTFLQDHPLLGNKFVPYQLEQVHGTIIGCEGWKTPAGIVNRWFKQLRQETKYINFSDLINYFKHQIDFPLNIRFGGYNRQTNYNFLSRQQHLYQRSFQLQSAAQNTIPVVIGWSWENESVTLAIDNLRRQLQQFNLLHKYHPTPDAIDNDFYLRLGTINTQLTLLEIDAISTDIRNFLEISPVNVPLCLNNLALVQYRDLLLTPSTTKVIAVKEATASQLRQLYPD